MRRERGDQKSCRVTILPDFRGPLPEGGQSNGQNYWVNRQRYMFRLNESITDVLALRPCFIHCLIVAHPLNFNHFYCYDAFILMPMDTNFIFRGRNLPPIFTVPRSKPPTDRHEERFCTLLRKKYFSTRMMVHAESSRRVKDTCAAKHSKPP